jgi:hypothetical protein
MVKVETREFDYIPAEADDGLAGRGASGWKVMSLGRRRSLAGALGGWIDNSRGII